MRNLIYISMATFFIGCSIAPKNTGLNQPPSVAASTTTSPESAAALAAKPLPDAKPVPDLDVPTADFKEFLADMKQSKETPTALRDKFSSLVNQQRQAYRTKTNHHRAEAQASQVEARAAFVAQQKKAREVYASTKHDMKENSRFNAEMERVRAKYFAVERAQHAKFEAQLASRGKSFEAAMHEWTVEFNEQYRLYAKHATEKPRAGKAVTGDEFHQMEQIPARPLGTED